MLSDADFAVLNAIYLKTIASAGTVAAATGFPVERVQAQLAAAANAGRVMPTPTGALLLPAGTGEVLDYYAAVYVDARAHPELSAWYAAFETLNAKFIAEVSEWQHTEGDEKVERRLLRTVQRLARNIGELVSLVPRYANYVRRFEEATAQVDQGLRDFVCKPTVDSVHNIWFEFHEDILAVLGRPRHTT